MFLGGGGEGGGRGGVLMHITVKVKLSLCHENARVARKECEEVEARAHSSRGGA